MISKEKVIEVQEEFNLLYQLSTIKRIPNEIFFRTINALDKKYKENEYYDFSIDGLICNIGIDYHDITILKFAYTRLKKRLTESQNNKFKYDISNCITSIADIETNPFNIELLLNNRKYIEARNGFATVEIDENHSYECAITNSANILEKYGRNYEAILLYDKALKINGKHGMTLGNKALAIDYYLQLLPNQPSKLINKVVELFTEALQDKSIIEIGGSKASEIFSKRRTVLSEYLKKINYVENKSNKHVKISAYYQFVINNNLFLNYDFGYYYDKHSLEDNLFPSIIENIKEEKSENITFMSKRSEYVFQMFNQILESFTTSRYLFYKNLNMKSKHNDKLVCYIYTFDYSQHSYRYGELKQIFQSLYSCLDKIAHLIAVYFTHSTNIISKDIYFKWLLTSEYKEIILQNNNRQLLALNSLALDFENGNQYSYLRIMRNRIAHTYININDMFINDNSKYVNVTEEFFYNSIIELFKIVKSALLYSMLSIAQIKPEEDIPSFFATLEEEIFE